MVVIKVLTVKAVDKALGAPALVATLTVAAITTARSSAGEFAGPVSVRGTLASATSRLRVPGSVILAVTTAGNGTGVKNGTTPKIVALSEEIGKMETAVSDKIGMTISGELKAMDSSFVDGTIEYEPPPPVNVPEKKSEYLSVWVTSVKVEENGEVE